MDAQQIIIKAYRSGYDVEEISAMVNMPVEIISRTIFSFREEDYIKSIQKCRMLNMTKKETMELFPGKTEEFIKADKLAYHNPDNALKKYDVVMDTNTHRQFYVVEVAEDIRLKASTTPYTTKRISKEEFYYNFIRIQNSRITITKRS